MAVLVPTKTTNMFVQEGINQRLRRRSQHLTPLDLQNDNNRNPFFMNNVSADETREEGKALLGTFIVEEISKEEDIETPQELREELCTPNGYKNPAWAKAGAELRRCADDFMKSRERKQVKKKAFEVTGDCDSVTEGQFRDLLSELLQGGITKERIIVLFCFCADVAIATLKRKVGESVQLCNQFIQWSFNFITEKVCSWVQEHGGWGAVFTSTMAVFGKAVMVVGGVLLCVYCINKLVNGKAVYN